MEMSMKKTTHKSRRRRVSNEENDLFYIHQKESKASIEREREKIERTKLQYSCILGQYINEIDDPDKFRACAQSFFRWTYRRNFNAINPYDITSDSGWGCMLRAAQMMMSHVLKCHYLGPNWKIPNSHRLEMLSQCKEYCQIVRWFLDFPGHNHIYSLHNMVQCGMKYDKLPGEWFGPSTVSFVLRDLAQVHRRHYEGELAVLVTQGDAIYISEAERLCSDLSLDDCLLGMLRDNKASTTADNSKDAQQESNDASNAETVREQLARIQSMRLSRRSLALSRSAEQLHDHLQQTPSQQTPSQQQQHPLPQQQRMQVCREESSDDDYSSDSERSSERQPTETLQDPLAPSGAGEFFDPLLRPPPSQTNPWRSALLVLMPLRLGISSVSKEHIEGIKDALRCKHCVGILGGRPNHAIYFVGFKENTLYGLDPHTVFRSHDLSEHSAAEPGSTLTDEFLAQVHVQDFVTLDFASLDPSLALGFYFPDRAAFEEFCRETRAKMLRADHSALGSTSLYQIQHTAPSYMFEPVDDPFNSMNCDHRLDDCGVLDMDDELDRAAKDGDLEDDDYVFI